MNGMAKQMQHGGNISLLQRLGESNSEKKWLDFSANINPLGLPESLKQAMVQAIDSIVEYPDYTYYQLKQTIASAHQVSIENVLVGNGATELLSILMQSLPKYVYLIEPSFSEYRIVAERYQKVIMAYSLTPTSNFNFAVDKFINWLDDQQANIQITNTYDQYQKNSEEYSPNTEFVQSKGTVLLCNPSNPTGTLIRKVDVIRLANALNERNIWLLVDQSFIDFVSQDDERNIYLQLFNLPNVILLHSLTKFYALPGIRLGFALCSNKELVRSASHFQDTWSINRIAEVAGIELFALKQFAHASRSYCQMERTFLNEQLSRWEQIRLFPASANFILLQTTLPKFYERMVEQGIVVRSCANYVGLDETYFRIAVRTRSENEQLLKAMELSYGEPTNSNDY